MKSPRPIFGFFLALNTAVFWGLLPIIVKQVMPAMDPVTIVWYRFAVAAAGLLLFLGCTKQLPRPTTFSRRQIWLFVLATIGLAGNFVLYNTSLKYIAPTATQVLGQIGPMLLLIISVPILKEHMHRSQTLGAVILIVGIVLFFNNSLREIFVHLDNYTLGIILGTAASIIWANYGIAQKLLSHTLNSQQILLVVYSLCALFLLPFASPALILKLNGWQLACLIFCAVNTLAAYGSFAESLACWQAAKTGAVIALTPLFTLVFSDLMNWLWPDLFEATILNWLGYIGALVVVGGMILSVIGHMWKPLRKPPQAHLSKLPPL